MIEGCYLISTLTGNTSYCELCVFNECILPTNGSLPIERIRHFAIQCDYFIHQKSIEQIALLHDVSERTVRRHIARREVTTLVKELSTRS